MLRISLNPIVSDGTIGHKVQGPVQNLRFNKNHFIQTRGLSKVQLPSALSVMKTRAGVKKSFF